jgi:hypothetical protein
VSVVRVREKMEPVTVLRVREKQKRQNLVPWSLIVDGRFFVFTGTDTNNGHESPYRPMQLRQHHADSFKQVFQF